MNSNTFQIPAMTEADVELIKTELTQIIGVRTVEIHEPTQSVTVTWTEPATMDDIWKRLVALNFTPDLPKEF